MQTERKFGFTLVELLVVIAIIGVLVGLLLPAVQAAREAARRMQCSNNFKQVGLAVLNYESTYSRLPCATRATTNPTSQHGWVPAIFPYMELGNIPYNFNLSWNDASNSTALTVNGKAVNQLVIPALICPSAPAAESRLGANNAAPSDLTIFINPIAQPNPFLTGPSASPYFPNNLPAADSTYHGALGLNVFRRLGEITDGTSNTIVTVECAGRNQLYVMGKIVTPTPAGTPAATGAWANPRVGIVASGYDPANPAAPIGPCAINCTNASNVYSFHTGVAHVGMLDGSVRGLAATTPLYLLTALRTRNGGEVVQVEP